MQILMVQWFIDNHLIGRGIANQPIDWIPTRGGLFKILVVDDLGRSDSRMVKVELL